MSVPLALGAALLAASAVVLQRVAIESSPHSSLSPRLLAHALRKRGWLAGMGLFLGVFALQAAALRRGQLSVVQPVLTTELIFLVAILVVGFRRRVGWREALGIFGVVAGLAAFFVLAAPSGGTGRPDATAWTVVSAVSAIAASALVLAGRAGPRWWRAAVLGAAAAVLFAYNAALTKTVTTLLRQGGWNAVFSSWEPYALALVGVTGLFLLQSALHAGPITASRTTTVIVNPLASIVIGITAFGEHLHTGASSVTAEAAALAVLCAGVVLLVRSPLVAGIGGDAQDEFLASTPLPPPVV